MSTTPVTEKQVLDCVNMLSKSVLRIKQGRDELLIELRSVCEELEKTWKLIGQTKPNYHALKARKLIAKLQSGGSMKLLLALVLILSFPGAVRADNSVEPLSSGKVQHCTLIGKTLCDAVYDKPVMALAVIHTVLTITDGVYTNRNVKLGATEEDPVSRLFIGRRPTWNRMAPIGIAWIIGETYLAERMRHSHKPIVRKLAFVPQVFGISSSAYGAAASMHGYYQ